MNEAAPKDETRRRSGPRFVLFGLLIGLAGCAFVVWIWSNLLDVPRGTSIRPMGQAVLSMYATCFTAVLGLPISVIGLVRGRGLWRWLAVLAIALCLAPWPLGHKLLHYIVDLRGLYLSP